MKVGIISDTHLKNPTPFLFRVIKQYFNDVDLILHAGDITSLNVLKAFNGKEVIAVAGNREKAEIRKSLPKKKVINLKHFKVGLVHGWGSPFGLQKRAGAIFDGIDCLVFGHSHWAVNQRFDNILYFNPGAFCGGVFSLWRRSIGILTIDQEIKGEIIRL